MKRTIAAAALLLSLAFFARAFAGEGPRVVASIKPIHSLAAAVMAGVAEPKLLVRGGQSPHTYALKPSDARALARAQLVFWVGPAMESFLIRPLKALDPSVHVVALAEEPRLTRYLVRNLDWPGARPPIVPLDAGALKMPERIDGHIWLDPRNAIIIVRRMAEELSRADPAHAETFARNADATIARLETLDRALEARLAPLREKPFVVFHDAYQYFEKRYGLAGVGALAINPELQPSVRKLKSLRNTLVAENVACAFAEPEFEPKLMITLTEGTRTRRATLDPEGAALAPGPELYFTLLDNLAAALAECLQAPASTAP